MVVIHPEDYAVVRIPYSNIVKTIYEREDGLSISSNDSRTFSVAVLPHDYYYIPADSYTVYPVEMYEGVKMYTYYVISAQSAYYSYNSMALIVAAYNNTFITITPTQTLTIPADLSYSGSDIDVTRGDTISISLHYLQTFLLTSNSDLSGTKVTSDKPIAFFSGHEFLRTYDLYQDSHSNSLIEQILPTHTWGMQFAFSPLLDPDKNLNSYIKIAPSANCTSVNLTCSPGSIQTYDLVGEGSQVVIPISSNASACTVTSSEPIMVVQMKLYSPLMATVPPLHLLTNDNIILLAYYGYSIEVNIVLTGDTVDTSKLLLDGSVINATLWNAAYLSNSDVIAYVTHVTLNDLIHTLNLTDSSMRMAATIYRPEFYSYLTYGHTLGMNLAISKGIGYYNSSILSHHSYIHHNHAVINCERCILCSLTLDKLGSVRNRSNYRCGGK